MIPQNPTPWKSRLAYDVALSIVGSGEADSEILTRYQLTEDQFREIAEKPEFQRQVTAYKKTIEEDGVLFKLKAAVLAEEMLEHDIPIILRSHDTSPNVKLDLFKYVSSLAGFEPEKKKHSSNLELEDKKETFSVNIVLNTHSTSEKPEVIAIEGTKE